MLAHYQKNIDPHTTRGDADYVHTSAHDGGGGLWSGVVAILLNCLWWVSAFAALAFLAVSYKTYHDSYASREHERITAALRIDYICRDMARAAELRMVDECDAYRVILSRNVQVWAVIDTMESLNVCGSKSCYDFLSTSMDRVLKIVAMSILSFVIGMYFLGKTIGKMMHKRNMGVYTLPTTTKKRNVYIDSAYPKVEVLKDD
jgi:hypothetical protein